MTSASAVRGTVLVLLVLRFLLVIPVARAGDETIKIGILHSSPKRRGTYSRRKRWRSCSAAGLPRPANPFCRSSSS